MTSDLKRKMFLGALGLVAIGILLWQFGFLNSLQKKIALFRSLQGIATLSWSANTDSGVAGYKIYYGTSPRTGDCPAGGYAKNIDAGKKTKYVLSNLEAGQTYYFSVTSYNSAKKESCFSQEMKKTISNSVLTRFKSLF